MLGKRWNVNVFFPGDLIPHDELVLGQPIERARCALESAARINCNVNLRRAIFEPTFAVSCTPKPLKDHGKKGIGDRK